MSSVRSVLITGGTGSLGQALVRSLVKDHPEVERIVIFSRDELKQFEMQQKFDAASSRLRFFLGDVRDVDRLKRALRDIDTVIHAAALKQVPAAEYNPFEFIRTNVMGAQNLIDACLDSDVKRVVALSTDKAAAPINLYGATKLCSDKLFSAANLFKGGRDLRFSVVRYGNVMASRGSVIPLFLRKRNEGILPITDSEMTRFNITLTRALEMIYHAIESAWGGEIFVPKIPSYSITALAEAVAPEAKQVIVGIRPGEKLHEEMITAADSPNTVELESHFVIIPSMSWWKHEDYLLETRGEKVPKGFAYQSGTNPHFLTVEEIREMIQLHVDPNFRPSQ